MVGARFCPLDNFPGGGVDERVSGVLPLRACHRCTRHPDSALPPSMNHLPSFALLTLLGPYTLGPTAPVQLPHCDGYSTVLYPPACENCDVVTLTHQITDAGCGGRCAWSVFGDVACNLDGVIGGYSVNTSGLIGCGEDATIRLPCVGQPGTPLATVYFSCTPVGC